MRQQSQSTFRDQCSNSASQSTLHRLPQMAQAFFLICASTPPSGASFCRHPTVVLSSSHPTLDSNVALEKSSRSAESNKALVAFLKATSPCSDQDHFNLSNAHICARKILIPLGVFLIIL